MAEGIDTGMAGINTGLQGLNPVRRQICKKIRAIFVSWGAKLASGAQSILGRRLSRQASPNTAAMLISGYPNVDGIFLSGWSPCSLIKY
jgi:hypothetical protein